MYNKTKVVAGISAGIIGVAGLFFGLGKLITYENNNDCKTIGLKGSITSCKVDKRYAYDNIVILTGNTANSPAPTLSKLAEKYVINSAFKHKGDDDFRIKIYSATPTMPKIASPSVSTPEDEEELASIIENYQDYETELNEAIASAPTEDGANYYDSIIRLGKELSSNNDDDEKTLLLVIGSGLSDCGTLDFSTTNTDALAMSTNDIVKKINEVNKISDDALDNVTIVWSYAGQTSAPQSELSNSQSDSLKEIYETVFDRMGAKKTIFDNENNSNRSSVATTYKVTPMQTSSTSLDWGSKDFKQDSAISFIGNSADLIDQNAARVELEPLAEELKRDHSKTVYITSYQARLCSGDNGINNSLLSSRSNKIQSMLESMGVDPSQIQSNSGGYGGSAQCEDQNDRRVTISVERNQ